MRRNYRHNATPAFEAGRHAQQIIELARTTRLLRPRDVEGAGIPREYLLRLHKQGLLERVGRGLYSLPGGEVTENHTLAEVCKRTPRGVICLLSALRFHGLTTQLPHEVWMAVGNKDRLPRTAWQVRFFRFSGRALTYGVQEHDVEGVPVRVYSAAKTVADCFKFRAKVGQDVAVEALRDCLHQRKAKAKDLWEAAEVCRVSRIIRPYLEALL